MSRNTNPMRPALYPSEPYYTYAGVLQLPKRHTKQDIKDLISMIAPLVLIAVALIGCAYTIGLIIERTAA